MCLQDVPGPGAYEIPSKVCSGPAYTMARRTRLSRRDDAAPGPGQYDTCVAETTRAGPAFTLAQRRTGPQLRGDLPGPGAYTADGDRYARAATHTTRGLVWNIRVSKSRSDVTETDALKHMVMCAA